MALTEHRQNVTLEYSLKDCIDALNEALDWKLSNDGVKLDRFDEKLNTFFLKAGVSAFSWGENLTVTMKANQNGTTEITIVSAPKTGTMFGGLTDMGKCVVKRMSEHGMMIDVSHANEKTFWDIMKYAQTPVIASHSNARALCDHPRNLYDEQLRAIADRDGLVGIVCAGAFVHRERDKQTVSQLVKHIQYLKQLIGIDHIALGCDFMDDYDNAQDTMLTDLNSPKGAQRIIIEMRKQGFNETEIKQIAYKNAYEFFQRHLD